jgi:succinyl-CoA synthetase beta subunit
MKLYEYEARDLFDEAKIPLNKWIVAKNYDEAMNNYKLLKFPIVVKAQVLVGGRGKAGGVKIANNEEELKMHVKNILGMNIKGEKVNSVILAEAAQIKKELYISIIVDRNSRSPLILASKEGGVDIEEVAKKDPHKIMKIKIDPFIGVRDYMVRRVESFLSISNINSILKGLYFTFKYYECELVEINPLALTDNDELVAIDAKIVIDDSALFRLNKFKNRISSELSYYENIARKYGFSYVEQEGDIGIIGNGAGLTMTTMDLVQYYGGRPANFLDIGGGADAEIVYNALSILLEQDRIKGIFINILGGITRCDEVAAGIIKAIKNKGVNKNIVVRMIGTNEEMGKKMLKEYNIDVFDEMEVAAKEIVNLVYKN